MRRDSDMEAWALFCRCVELGSIRRACEERSEDPSAASRLLRSLERSVGVTLFDHTRKPAALTPAGARAFRAMAPVLEAYGRAVSAIREDPREAGGPITIASPAGFGAEVLPGLFMEFQAENPGIDSSGPRSRPVSSGRPPQGRPAPRTYSAPTGRDFL